MPEFMNHAYKIRNKLIPEVIIFLNRHQENFIRRAVEAFFLFNFPVQYQPRFLFNRLRYIFTPLEYRH